MDFLFRVARGLAFSGVAEMVIVVSLCHVGVTFSSSLPLAALSVALAFTAKRGQRSSPLSWHHSRVFVDSTSVVSS